MGDEVVMHIKGDCIQKKSRLVLLKLVSLPGIVHGSLAVASAILLLSESVAATPGRMGVRIAQQPTATSQDATRAAAERVFLEGKQLYKQGTADSLRQAIAKYEEALSLYRAVGDKAREATTLNNIGLVYDDLGEKQKALDYYNQSLPLSRAVSDKATEAIILNNIGAVYDALGEKQKALDSYNQSLPLFRAVDNKAYSLGEERSYLWAVTKTSITSYELPPRAEIETAAQEFYKQLKSEAGNIEEGMKLSQMILAPVMNQLGNKRLLIVGDGALQSIPFAALPIPANTQVSVLPALRLGINSEANSSSRL